MGRSNAIYRKYTSVLFRKDKDRDSNGNVNRKLFLSAVILNYLNG